MSRHVAIVTDSTAYLPPLTMERHGITAVPLTVVLGDRALEEGTEISTRSLAQALQKRRSVTTSRPSPQLFADTYRKVAESGATGIVSLHLSAELSGTYDAAVVAAREAPVPVRVVDTGMVAMALGFCALAAAETADAGGTVDEAVTAAEKRAAGTSAFLLRRHPGLSPPGRPYRRGPGPVRLRARCETAAPAGGRAHRTPGEGPDGVEGDRPP